MASFITATSIQAQFDAENPLTVSEYAAFAMSEINKLIHARYEYLGYGNELALEAPVHQGNIIASRALWAANVDAIVTQLESAGWVGRTEAGAPVLVFISLP
jgi:hypothetical protein